MRQQCLEVIPKVRNKKRPGLIVSLKISHGKIKASLKGPTVFCNYRLLTVNEKLNYEKIEN